MSERLAESRYSSIRVMCPSFTCRYIAVRHEPAGHLLRHLLRRAGPVTGQR